MFCTNCGKELENETKVCPACGTAVEEAEEVTSVETQEVPQQEPAAPEGTIAEKLTKKAAGLSKKAMVGIVSVVAALAVVAGGVAFAGPISRALAPEKAYRKAEQKHLESVVEDLLVCYDNGIDELVKYKNTGESLEVSVSAGETVLQLIEELTDVELGESAKLGVKLGVETKEDDYKVTGNLLWGGKALLSPEIILDTDQSALYVRVPEVDKNTLLFALEDWTEEDICAVLIENNEMLESLSKAYPKSKMLQGMFSSYLEAALDAIEDDRIKHSKTELKAGKVKQKCTKYTVTMDAEELAQVAIAFLEAIQEDERMKEIVTTFVDATAEEDYSGDDAYAELEEGIDYLIDYFKEEFESTETEVKMVAYVGSDGEIYGREIEVEGSYEEYDWWYDSYEKVPYEWNITMLAPENGSQWGLELEISDAEYTYLEVSGEGKLSGDKRNGELEVIVDDVELGVLQLKDVRVASALRGELSGTVSYALGELDGIDELEEELEYLADELPNGADDIVEDIAAELDTAVIEVSLDGTLEKASATVSLKLGKEELVGFSMATETTGGGGVKIPSKAVEITNEEDLLDWAEGIEFEDVLIQLEKKGVPEEIVELLETLVDFYLD